MFLCTPEQMRAIDRRTIDEHGVSGLTLMERAGEAVASAAAAMLGTVEGKRVVILCGKGNNGGDGFVCGRVLAQRGARVCCLLLSDRSSVAGAARTSLDRVERASVAVEEITDPSRLDSAPQADLMIDAILGTGLTGPPRGLAAAGIAFLNRMDAPVLAIDVPSGLTTDAGWPAPERRAQWRCVRATRTVAVGLMKVDLARYPGKAWAGCVEVADIGFPPEAIAAEGLWLALPEREEMRRLLPRSSPEAHKGDCGRVVVLAGSVGMSGAAALTADAVMRAGAGMAILGIPESLFPVMAVKLTEVMPRPLPETPAHTLSLGAARAIGRLMDWGDVLALGPGLSRHAETAALVRRLVGDATRTMVIDADGINAFVGHAASLQSRRAEAVLTPHTGELARLLERPAREIQADRIGIARETAQRLGVTLVLKGAGSVVAGPDGRVSLNPTGNAGMATAGTGDVLTGIIAGLLAQGCTPFEAAVLGVYLHGLAGDCAAASLGPHSLMAGDLITRLPQAILRVNS